MTMQLPAGLLEIMQCPVCAGTLAEIPEPAALQCQSCGLRYPVDNGIPVMLIEEAVGPDEWDTATGHG